MDRAVKRHLSYIEDDKTRFTLLFTMEEKVGALQEALQVFTSSGVSMTHIESRISIKSPQAYDFLVDFDSAPQQLEVLLDALKAKTSHIQLLNSGSAVQTKTLQDATIPWFPRKKADLDRYAEKSLEYGSELEADHPGFADEAYRKRRTDIVLNARNYKSGDALPHVDYTPEEKETWGVVFRKLTALYPSHACKEFNRILPLLTANCGYNDSNIPQIADVSRFLKDCTGFTLRPVGGLLTSRDFLNGLAFRVFHSTQYIRHHSKPLYTPEPDVCHELLGHAPLFADPDFADFSQEIGLASLGATDDEIAKLSTLYWFTVEFGLCMEDGKPKAYGAGLLSSFGELEYCVKSKEEGGPEHKPFNPLETAVTPYPITSYQPLYFVANSFHDAKEKLKAFTATLTRPFGVRYNAYTESVEVLDSSKSIARYSKTINNEMNNLNDAIQRLGEL
eukprot:Colp12_sorted_trinity150504_noHs@31123